MSSDHELWIATTGGDPLDFIDPDALIKVLVSSLSAAAPPEAALADTAKVTELEQRLQAASAEAETWQSKYEWLCNRPLIRTALAVKRLLSRFMPSVRGPWGGQG